jgi:WD40 repeat protein
MGFDEARGIVWVLPTSASAVDECQNAVLRPRAYEYHTGELSQELNVSTRPIERNPSDGAQMLLSPEGSYAVIWPSMNSDRVAVVSMHTGELKWSKLLGMSNIDSLGFSRDGQRLAARGLGTIYVWDSASGRRLAVHDMPHDMVIFSRVGSWDTDLDRIDLSDDGRFLAVAGDRKGVAVLDLQTGKRVGTCQEALLCKFMPDRTTLVTVHTKDLVTPAQVKWYDCTANGVGQIESKVLTAWESEYLQGFGSGVAIGGVRDSVTVDLPVSWLPADWQTALQRVLGRTNDSARLKLVDLASGSRLQTMHVNYKSTFDAKLSPSNRFLAVSDDEKVTVWDVPPDRPTSCRITCMGLALLAVYVGWPRKVKTLSQSN